MRQFFFRFVLTLLLFPACTTKAQTTAPPDFRPLVRAALQRGEKRITIAPGTYRLAPEAGQSVVWTLQKLRDVEIIADNVTLICTKLTRALEIRACQNLTLQGLTIDYDPLPFTQGTIIAAAPDQSWIDIQIHAGYPRQAYSRIDIVDPKTRFRKRGMPFLWGTKAEMSAPDVVRITLPNIAEAAAIGDLASLSTDSVLWISQTKNVTLAGNAIENLGRFAGPTVVITPSVENVSGRENGVRIRERD